MSKEYRDSLRASDREDRALKQPTTGCYRSRSGIRVNLPRRSRFSGPDTVSWRGARFIAVPVLEETELARSEEGQAIGTWPSKEPWCRVRGSAPYLSE